MRRYRVSGKGPIVDFIAGAIKASGGEVLRKPPPTWAPFEFLVRTPAGERLELICYAFLANKYKQKGRPKDEHRFQIKYGSEFDDYHHLYLADGVGDATLMFGVHLERGVFVAVDPAMHNPTWFSKSVEFKSEQLDQVRRLGWYGWERARVAGGRRKRPLSLLSCQTEVLVGLSPEHFFRYVQLERAAIALDAGQRLLLTDRMAVVPGPVSTRPRHPLEEAMGLSAEEILGVIDGAFRLRVAVRGAVAERHLGKQLSRVPGVHDVEALDEDGAPDFRVYFRGEGPFTIECKNVLRRMTRGRVKVDFQKTRASKHDPCSRYYSRDDFHVLAACLQPVSEAWDFRFCRTMDLPEHEKCPGRLSHKDVFVDEAHWSDELPGVLERVAGR